MGNYGLKKQFELEQYKNQANLVYINTLIFSFILLFVFLIQVESVLIAGLNFFAAIVCGFAIWLNRIPRYGLSSLIYICFITLVTCVEVFELGFNAGFQYIFFSLVGLIMFSNWRSWQKNIGVVVEAILAITLFFLVYNKTPSTRMSHEMLSFFHTSNILLNIVGVANSAHYYISIATKAHNKANILATRDYLTNLMNRGSFNDYMIDIFEDRKNSDQGLGILILDIDHFKVINDTFGHICGDEILRQLADILSANVRTGDCAARYGGEEFVIVVNMEQFDQLQNFAERLRQEIENQKFQYNYEEKHITVSIGAMFISPNAVIHQDQVLSRADKLLYRAKAEGRNRVVVEHVET